MDNGFLDSFFDFNDDGELDVAEQTAEFIAFDEEADDEETDSDDYDEDDSDSDDCDF